MGSEMCIRDRTESVLAQERLGSIHPREVLLRDAGAVRKTRRQAGERLLVPRCQSEFCLLYTSDAADERSSVDIGGRRII